MKVIFFILIVLLFKLLFYVNFYVINWFGRNFKYFSKIKGKLKKVIFVNWFIFRSIICCFFRLLDVSLN